MDLVGCRVRVTGLSARPGLNGQIGEVTGFKPATGRLVVTMPSGEMCGVRVANVEEVASRSSRSVPMSQTAAAFFRGYEPTCLSVFAFLVLHLGFRMEIPKAALLVAAGFLIYAASTSRAVYESGMRAVNSLQQRTGMAPMQLLAGAGAGCLGIWYLSSSSSHGGGPCLFRVPH